MRARWMLVPLFTLMAAATAQAAGCPALLEKQGSLPELRGKEQIDLCERFAGKPLVVINTASYCGFAPQFEGLESVYKTYHEQGLEMLGVPSNDFKQEDADLEKTAKVCYANYGVTFTMTKPQPVRGSDATALFKELAEQSSAPKWNFYKYVVDRQGKVVASFSSLTKPNDPEFTAAIEKAIASQP
ncbi:glutathione peroxidase [Pseudomonas sp. P66]|jgi:glutathione peroxidase|uniref:Glutathione peroxidase n=2 Tax=Pseudomonas TaxID=286 RepID=A0AB35WR52_9PSED|nr:MULTISPECIES: glutathione peroxidase [Pseudomonas]MBM3106771.1 glutathione peroxidase [Pseudomonas arcuscaelestis]MBM5460460.1 glutathione peroxidase [Pseudomonas arcuscaelestis]MEE1867068.1 glutathione peroxidase [Pseudomonas sp. 120P]MEE1957895.1 glutathione peroxidase [Pseudomonas sp. 119P]